MIQLPRIIYFYLTAFLVESGLMLIILAEPVHALQSWHATSVQLGVLGTLANGGYALMALTAGHWSDRTGRRRWQISGLIGQALAGLLLPFCDGLPSFVVVAIVHNTVLGCFWAPLMSQLSEATPPGVLARSLGKYNMSWCAGAIFGSVGSGMLYERVGPAAPFVCGGVMTALALVIVALGNPAPKVVRGPMPAHRTHAAAAGFLRQARVAMITAFFMASLLIYLFPKLAATLPRPLPFEAIGRLHGWRLGTMFLTFAVMGMTRAWHFRHWPIHVCMGLMIAMALGTAALRSEWQFIAPYIALGIGMGMSYGLSAYYGMLAPKARGGSMGMHEALLSTGSTLGPIFGGWMIASTGRLTMPFWAGSALAVGAYALALRFTKGIARAPHGAPDLASDLESADVDSEPPPAAIHGPRS